MHFFSDADEEESPKISEAATLPAPPPQVAAINPDDGKTIRPEKEEKEKKPDAQDEKKTAAKPEPKPQPVKPREPRFTFYKILPEKEVIIPESEIKTIKREERLGNQPASVLYLVQAGSFDNLQSAEQLKDDLAKIRIKAKIEMIEIENSAWYRVKIGPYATLADADKVRAYLRKKGIDSIVQKAAK
ncbi:SPOR domain-containing protein [Methylocaldum sp. MU1018]